jgi:ubiquinone/menaquinone biosynthesis C-methylase UbiE
MSGPEQRTLDALAAAYDTGAGAWRAGPERVYGALARALVAAAGRPLHGARALDAGTGGGAVARCLAAAGAVVVGVDRAAGQLRGGRPRPAAVGDLLRLPVRPAVLDVAAAGFVLNHLDRPADGLRELVRVTRPGGLVLASTFRTGPVEPVKAAVEAVAAGFGWVRPDWYEHVKRVAEPQVSDPAALRGVAAAAGLDAVVLERVVAVPLTTAEALDWRLGMPALAPFVADLPPRRRDALLAEAGAALDVAALTVRLPVLLLRATA